MNPRILATLLVLSLALVPTAAAHKTAYTPEGNVKIVWGFLNEPAVTMDKTGIDLVLTDNATGAAILGAADTVEVRLKHGEDEIHLEDLGARFGNPGSYTQVITLTKPGLYTLVLRGTINGTEVDMAIPAAHEVAPISETYFPDLEAADTAALAAKVAQLETKVAALEAKAVTQSTTPAPTSTQPPPGGNDAPALGIVGALSALGVVLLLRRRS